jgi:hypothetical protein
MRNAKLTLVCFLMLCAPAAAYAQDATGNPENWCRNGAFPADGPVFKIARVVGQRNAKIHFLGDEEDCPQSNNAKCLKKSYLIPGNEVIVSRKFGSWMCSWYQPEEGSETVGWLPLNSLRVIEPTTTPSLEQWAGMWRDYDNRLVINTDGSASPHLRVEGQAYWRGLGDNVNEGSFAGRAKPQGNQLTIEDDGCKVSLIRVGRFLIAHDNFQCGGMNVRFDGVYRRRQPGERTAP